MSATKADTKGMSHPAVTVEVMVIGGGVIGSSIAYHVARQGRKVLVVDRNEVAVEPAASWASAGGVRLWEQDPADAAPPPPPPARRPPPAPAPAATLHPRQ